MKYGMKKAVTVFAYVYVILSLLFHGGVLIYGKLYSYYVYPAIPIGFQIVLSLLVFAAYLVIRSKVGAVVATLSVLVMLYVYPYSAVPCLLCIVALIFIPFMKKYRVKCVILSIFVLLFCIVFHLATVILSDRFTTHVVYNRFESPDGIYCVYRTEYYNFSECRTTSFYLGKNDDFVFGPVRMRVIRDGGTFLAIKGVRNSEKPEVVEWLDNTKCLVDGILHTVKDGDFD